MKSTLKAGIAVMLIGSLVAGVLIVRHNRSRAPVTVTLRFSVSPREQVSPVAEQANSARFKYLLGKQAGVKPALAQKLTVKPVHDSTLLEARIGVLTKEEGRRYADAFLQALQALCGNQVQLALSSQSIR